MINELKLKSVLMQFIVVSTVKSSEFISPTEMYSDNETDPVHPEAVVISRLTS